MTELDLRPFKTLPNVLGIPAGVIVTFGGMCGARDIQCDSRIMHMNPYEFDIITTADSIALVETAIAEREKQMLELFMSKGATADMLDVYVTVRSNWTASVYEDGSVFCALKQMSATRICGGDFQSFRVGHVE